MAEKSLETLFVDYFDSDREWQEAKKAVELAYAKRSDIVKAIHDKNGGKNTIKYRKGNGDILTLTIVCRPNAYHFRGLDTDDVPVVGKK